MPEVSVIIPTYNREQQTLRAVRSVLQQLGVSFELVVVDDGSTEPTSSLKEFVESAGHVFIRQENSGVAAARNRGVEASSAPYLTFLDSDDEWLEGKLEKQVSFHRNNPLVEISQTEEIWIRKHRRVNPKLRHKKPQGEFFEVALELCCISPSSVFLSRKLYREMGGFDERFRVCEDYDLWLRIALRHEVGLIEEFLVKKYGGHSDQLSRSEVAIDRFRVFSMLKLLEGEKLSGRQRELLRSELRQKITVLSMGAKKHGNQELLSMLESLLMILDFEGRKGEVSSKEFESLLQSTATAHGLEV